MKTIVNQMLEADEFHIEKLIADELDITDGLIAINDEKNLFYVIIFIDSFDEVEKQFDEIQTNIYEEMMKYERANVYKNNCYMVLCVNELGDNRNKRIVQELEESNVFFKKYVLCYENEEVEDLKRMLGDKNINELVKENMYKTELFEDYKVKRRLSFYSLLMKMAIKLPHFKIAYGEETSIKSVEDRISESIDEKKFNEIELYYTNFTTSEFQIFISNLLGVKEESNE